MSHQHQLMDLSESLIKSRSNTFDLESITVLQLRECSQSRREASDGDAVYDLRSLHPCLSSCHSLFYLDLSSNSLTSSSLSALSVPCLTQKLKYLNLSYNKIDSLEDLPCLDGLKELSLIGNRLKEGERDLTIIQEKCPKLKVLWLCDSLSANGIAAVPSSSASSNPLCSSTNYRTSVLSLLPSLHVLDGERLKVKGDGKEKSANSNKGRNGSATSAASLKPVTFYNTYRTLELETRKYDGMKITAVTDNNKNARKSQEVIAKLSDKEIAGRMEEWIKDDPILPLTASSLDHELAPRLNTLRASLNECRSLLQDECDQLIREYEGKYSSSATNGSSDKQNTNSHSNGGSSRTSARSSSRSSLNSQRERPQTSEHHEDSNFGTFGDPDD